MSQQQPDLELNVGINLQQLQADAAQAAQIVQQQFNLGTSGGPVNLQTAASLSTIAGQQQMTQTLRGLTAAINQMNTATQQMVQAVQQMSGNRSGSRPGTPGAPGQPAQPSPGGSTPGTPGSQPSENEQAIANARGRHIAHGINILSNMAQSGFSAGSMWRGAGDVASMFGPKGMVVGALMHAAAAVADKEYELGEGRQRVWRAGGNAARSEFVNQTTGSIPIGYGWQRGSIQEMGLSSKRYEELLIHLIEKTGGTSNNLDVARLEAGYGQGGGAIELLGALKRGGSESGRRELGQAIGLFLAQGLERGRVGETFSMLAHIAASTISKVVDTGAEARTLDFIGGMGPGYQGDTPKAHHALQTLERMSRGEGSAVTRMFALQQGGLGRGGKGYWEANLEVSKGLDDKRALIGRFAEMPQIKREWQSGNKAKAAGILAMMAGVEPWLAERFLEGYYSGKGVEDVTKGREGDITKAFDVKPSDYDRKAVDAQNRKDLMARETVAPGYGKDVARSGGTGGLEKPQQVPGGLPAWNGGGVSSVSEAKSKYGDNFGQQRSLGITDGRYEQLPNGETRTHDSVDVKLPPGSPVYLAVSGVVKAIGQAMADKAYGYFLEQAGDDGCKYKFVHLQDRPTLQIGKKYPAGTFIGVTLKGSMPGGTTSELHLQVKDKTGKSVNPYDALGVEGFNRMIGASQREVLASRNRHLQHPSSTTPGFHPNTGMVGSSFGAPSPFGDTSGLFSRAGAGQPVTHRFEITVRDGQKSTITRAASRGPTAPGQMVSTTVRGDL